MSDSAQANETRISTEKYHLDTSAFSVRLVSGLDPSSRISHVALLCDAPSPGCNLFCLFVCVSNCVLWAALAPTELVADMTRSKTQTGWKRCQVEEDAPKAPEKVWVFHALEESSARASARLPWISHSWLSKQCAR